MNQFIIIQDGLFYIPGAFFVDINLLLASIFAGVAAAIDARSSRIPNWLIVWGGVVGLIYQAASPWGSGSGFAIGGIGAGLALMLPLYLLHAMGAGDVKLMAMLGIWLGPWGVAAAAVLSYIAGGVLGLAITLRKRAFRQLVANLQLMVTGSAVRLSTGHMPAVDEPVTVGRMPFGVAIALGTLAFVILKQTGHLTFG